MKRLRVNLHIAFQPCDQVHPFISIESKITGSHLTNYIAHGKLVFRNAG